MFLKTRGAQSLLHPGDVLKLPGFGTRENPNQGGPLSYLGPPHAARGIYFRVTLFPTLFLRGAPRNYQCVYFTLSEVSQSLVIG